MRHSLCNRGGSHLILSHISYQSCPYSQVKKKKAGIVPIEEIVDHWQVHRITQLAPSRDDCKAQKFEAAGPEQQHQGTATQVNLSCSNKTGSPANITEQGRIHPCTSCKPSMHCPEKCLPFLPHKSVASSGYFYFSTGSKCWKDYAYGRPPLLPEVLVLARPDFKGLLSMGGRAQTARRTHYASYQYV
jgi:hypothetical protein